jgi:hypothetical protein
MIRNGGLRCSRDEGRHRAGVPRTEVESTTSRRHEQPIGRRPDQKGHVSPRNRPNIKQLEM